MHKHPTLRIAAGCLACLALSSIAQAALIAHWTFDSPENPGQDASGNGHHLELRGAVRTSDAARGAGGLRTAAGYAITPNTPALQLAGSYTMAAWVNAIDLIGNAMGSVVALHASRVDNDGSWDFQYSPGPGGGGAIGHAEWTSYPATWYATWGAGQGPGDPSWGDVGVTPVFRPGEWAHIAATYDDLTHTASLYLDGVLVRRGTWVSSVGGSVAPLTVGTDHLRADGTLEGVRDFFPGDIDDIRLYDHALTEAEVAALATVPEAGSTGALLVLGMLAGCGWRRSRQGLGKSQR